MVGADDTPVATGTYTHTVTDTAGLDTFGALKGYEVERYNQHVSDWDIDEYLHHL